MYSSRFVMDGVEGLESDFLATICFTRRAPNMHSHLVGRGQWFNLPLEEDQHFRHLVVGHGPNLEAKPWVGEWRFIPKDVLASVESVHWVLLFTHDGDVLVIIVQHTTQ